MIRRCVKCGAEVRTKKFTDNASLLNFLRSHGVEFKVPEKYREQIAELVGDITPDPIIKALIEKARTDPLKALKIAKSSTAIMQAYKKSQETAVLAREMAVRIGEALRNNNCFSLRL